MKTSNMAKYGRSRTMGEGLLGNNTKRFGFSKELRLKSQAEFQAVFSEPIRSRSPFFTVLAKPNDNGLARLGIIVAKRYVKNAVDRNRARRLIRESFRLHQERLKGLNVIVLVRKALDRNDAKAPERYLRQQWKEIVSVCMGVQEQGVNGG